jgi:hypothetical protein
MMKATETGQALTALLVSALEQLFFNYDASQEGGVARCYEYRRLLKLTPEKYANKTKTIAIFK